MILVSGATVSPTESVIRKLNCLTVAPTECRERDEASNLKTVDVIMRCLIRTHLSNGGRTVSMGKPKKLGEKSASMPFHPTIHNLRRSYPESNKRLRGDKAYEHEGPKARLYVNRKRQTNRTEV
jgi:hypothetical protein